MGLRVRKRVLATISAIAAAVAGVLVGQPANAATDTPVERSGAEFRTLDDTYYDIAKEVPGFAGARLESDGTTTVFLTRPNAEVAANASDALRALWPNFGARTRTVPVRHDFVQLKNWYDSFAGDVFAVPGVVMTDIDEGGNRLYVGVSDLASAEAVRELAKARGVPDGVVHVGKREPVVPNHLQNRHRPVVGGLQIAFGGFVCTLGFVARYANIDGFLTNSHCTHTQGGTQGTSYGQPSLAANDAIGTETVDPALFTGGSCPSGFRCRWSDAAFANTYAYVTSSRGWVARTNPGTPAWNGTDRLQIRAKWDHPPLGTVIGKTGRTTGTTRGVVNNTCANIGVSGTNIGLLCQGIGSYASQGGDSGSGVWEESMGVASGLHWGSGGAFSPWGNIEYELGTVSVCASGC